MVAVLAVRPPSDSVWDAADLLHVEVDHVAWPTGDDLLWLSIRVAVGIDELAPVQPKGCQMPGDGPPTDGHPAAQSADREVFVGDAILLVNEGGLARHSCPGHMPHSGVCPGFSGRVPAGGADFWAQVHAGVSDWAAAFLPSAIAASTVRGHTTSPARLA